jgi:DNA segregation ATPase FtsK/SpoIIIE, S-DNA-T family
MNVKKQRNTLKSQKLLFEIYGILIISFSVLLLISVYNSSTGILGNIISTAAKGLCGLGAYIIPFFILLIGIGLIVKQDKITLKLKFYALISLFIFLLILVEISKSSDMNITGFINKVKNAYTNGSIGIGGGAIGEILAYPIIKLLGITGAYLFSCTFIAINILIITNASIYKILLSIKAILCNLFDKFKSNIFDKFKSNALKKPKDEKLKEINTNIMGIKKIDDDNDKKKYIQEVNKKIKILDFFKSSEISNTIEKDIENDDLHIEYSKHQLELDSNHEDLHVSPQVSVNSTVSVNPKVSEIRIRDEITPISRPKHQEYIYPSINLLNPPASIKGGNDKKELINNANLLRETLESFGVEAKVIQVSRGPVITRYELQPSPGVKVSKIVNLSDDIALNLAAPSVRIEAPIPGKAAVGIEIPNKEMSAVFLREVIESKEFQEQNSPLTFALGKDVTGNCIVADLSKMPHLLIAGATGSGKSVCINALITSILYKSTPERAKLLLIDPKVVELNTYNGIPHLLIPVVTDPRKAAGALGWAVQEMTNRYKLFADNNVRNIESYNELKFKKSPELVLPKIIIIIDELADLMMVAANDVEDCICRLAQMARAAGMHLVVATQRPSVDVITGVIKANIPSRISFAVSSQIDSRTILDMAGAEKLLGKGDMLYYPIGESKPIRIQGAFITEKEVEQVVGFIKNQVSSDYKEDIIDVIENVNSDLTNSDEILPEAVKIVVETGQASISLLQRRLRVGYNRAARLIDSMEERGIIGSYEGSKPRQVLVTKEEYEEML